MTKSTNSLERQPATSRRQVVVFAAGLATAAVLATWVYSLRYPRQTAVAGPIKGPKKGRLPASELTKPGPLPEIVVGKEDAPITIVEYADLTCPACAAFHKNVLPKLKEKYIDTGKVRLMFREFATNTPSRVAFMTVRCAGIEKAWGLVSALFTRQDEWRVASTFDELRDKLFSFGQQVGLTRQAFDACIPTPKGDKIELTATQEKLYNDIMTVGARGHQGFGVNQTPTFFVNGKRLPHATMEEFEKAITPLLNP